MSSSWIVDGSNVGGALAGEQGARDRRAVWGLVSAWAARRRVVVVFDGPADLDLPTRLGGLEVRWSGRRSADQVILAAIRERPRSWRVVTDDRTLAAACRHLGAKVETARAWIAAATPRPANQAAGVEAKASDAPIDAEDWLAWFARGGDR